MELAENLTVDTRKCVPFVENVLDYFPDNPLQDPFGKYWIHMTNNYTAFQIATFGSLILHEVFKYLF